MLHTKVIAADDYFDDFRKSVQEISDNILILQNNESVFINKDSGIFYLDGIAESLQCIEYKETLTKMIVDLLVNQSLRAFWFSPFFADFSILYSVEMLKHLLTEKSSNRDTVGPLDEFEKDLFLKVSHCSTLGTSTELFNFINKLQKPALSLQLIDSSCRYAGLDGKIFIEPNREAHTVLEVKNSHSFSIETFDEFFFGSDSWNCNFVNCIVIDGIIESVSEIHHLLEGASKSIDPVVLISRGFGDDVLQTLYVNMERKTLNVFPLKLKTDESLMNAFVDISVVAKTDPVSYLKGELISSIDYDSISTVEHIEVKKGELLIVNPASDLSIRMHLDRLRSAIEEKRKSLDSYTFDLYETSIRARIRSLSSKSIHISLDKSVSADNIKKIKKDIDAGFRTVPIVRDYGMIQIKDFESSHELKHKILIDSIKAFFKNSKSLPAGSLVRVVKACHENLKLLICTSGALIYESDSTD